MPTVFIQDGFRVFFYSNEGDPREPVHVHVRKARAEAKFWLRPFVSVADSSGFDARALREAARIVAARRDEIERAWDEHFT
jgi:hypothetical protein